MTLRIPAAARPVVEIIRREVKRPSRPPSRVASWENENCFVLRWHGGCPIGLHPDSFSEAPGTVLNAARVFRKHEEAFHSFIKWWDAQTDARAAMDAVWPKARVKHAVNNKAKARKRGK